MASGTSGKRRTNTQKKTTKTNTVSKRTAAKKQAETEFIRDEVKVLILFAVSVLLLISNFGIGGAAGAFVSGIMFGLFGLFAYILPVVLFLVAAFSISNRENTIAAVKVAAMIVAGLLLCAVLQLINGEKDSLGTFAAFYAYSAEKKLGGGALGGLISKVLAGAFGMVGAWVILLVLLIICGVIISERSFISGVKSSGKKVYDTAMEDAERHRILAEERREARKKAMEERAAALAAEQAKEQEAKLQEEEPVPEMPKVNRVEKKASGVDLTGTSMKKEEHTDEMREITLGAGPHLKDLDEMFRIPIHRQKVEENEDVGEIPFDMQCAVEEEPAYTQEELPIFEPDPIVFEEASPVFPGGTQPQVRTVGAQAVLPKKQTQSIHGHASMPIEPREKAPVEEVEPSNVIKMPAPKPVRKRPYVYPPLRLLNQVKNSGSRESDKELQDTALHLQQILRDFGVGVTVTDVSQGPAITRYELQPDQGVKVSKIVALSDDIKLNLAVADIRIEAPIPGKAAVGIEVPNAESSVVSFRELVSSQDFKGHKSKIAFAVGKDIAGKIMVTDIAKMPHLLIAGATGSGKSVCINTLIMSILYKADPEEVKLIMVDPKVVELSVYNGIPHLLIPVVTDPKKAASALNWAVAEMTNRYKLFAEYNVRNIQGYNEKIKEIEHIEDENKPQKMPQIVIIVDELADLMMVASGEVEDAICRLAQLARAAGIHLIIATQRPSVNVITGLIKANMPSRIAFAVSSGVDSRTILDMNGAEKLLGKGDMLFYPYGYPKPVRMQGAFVSDEEVSAVVEFLKENNSSAAYSNEIEQQINTVQAPMQETENPSGGPERDALFTEAGRFIIEKDKASIGMLQRWFKVGFNRAARIMDQLAEAGVVGEEAGTKPREILMTMEEFERYLEEYV